MKNIDQVELYHYCSIEKDEMNNLMNNINTQIDGRVYAGFHSKEEFEKEILNCHYFFFLL